jgi:mutator protein MutT
MQCGPEDRQVVEVAVAIVRRGGLWLVAKRHPDVHLGGLWEFPGGKLHPGEPPADAALRELTEECAVSARIERQLPAATHVYDDRTVRIHPILCVWEHGEPRPVGSEQCCWVSTEALVALDMPILSKAIIADLLRS